MSNSAYLDYNATAPLRPEAAAAMAGWFDRVGNPSSVHGFGRQARRAVEDVRELLAGALGVGPGQVIFTSGGTEANNLALNGFPSRRLVVSAGEHDSVLQAAPQAVRIPLGRDGVVALAALAEALNSEAAPALVSVMGANNETGVLQPIEPVVALAQETGALVHCDAVQALGKMPLNMAGLDLLSLSGHKFGAPQGIGALVLREGLALAPLLRGGGQERSRRSGTENLLGIIGFGAALAAALEQQAGEADRLTALRDSFESRLIERCPAVEIFGREASRLPNTSCFGLRGLAAETQVMALDLAGYAVSAGSACSSGKVHPSHVLRAMGHDDEAASSAIRVSLGWQSTESELEGLIAAWMPLAERCQPARNRSPSAA